MVTSVLLSLQHKTASFYHHKATRSLPCLILHLCLLFSANGCSGISKGITEAILEKSVAPEDSRMCYIHGRPFEGLATFLEHQGQNSAAQNSDPVLKILMVHGIGTHQPGYSTRLSENLALTLNLNHIDEQTKILSIAEEFDSGRELGLLRINRYRNATSQRQMIIAELTWDPIVEKEKATLSFDNSGEYSFRRTFVNNSLKEFVNATIPDVLMYYGSSRLPIQLAVGQSMCWLMNYNWEELPDKGRWFCDTNGPQSLSRIQDDFVFITHSLGSRITVDALQLIASAVAKRSQTDSSLATVMKQLQEKDFSVIMLSNQLPLLQMGQPGPEVSGRIPDLCGPQATAQEERMFKETRLIAFTDPNDLLSYAIPRSFVDENIDSRLCPTLTNIITNVADITSFLGGEFVNPLSAHGNYDTDDMVIKLISHGVGGPDDGSAITGQCRRIETIPANQRLINQ